MAGLCVGSVITLVLTWGLVEVAGLARLSGLGSGIWFAEFLLSFVLLIVAGSLWSAWVLE